MSALLTTQCLTCQRLSARFRRFVHIYDVQDDISHTKIECVTKRREVWYSRERAGAHAHWTCVEGSHVLGRFIRNKPTHQTGWNQGSEAKRLQMNT
jgi:hypothetical protein